MLNLQVRNKMMEGYLGSNIGLLFLRIKSSVFVAKVYNKRNNFWLLKGATYEEIDRCVANY